MKKITIITALVLSTFIAFAQTPDLRRKIEVTGTAEQEVTPDIIYVSITLQEYMDGKNKVDISTLEEQLQSAVKEAGIPKEDFTIINVSAYTDWRNRGKVVNLMASKQYHIKFHELSKYDQILSQVNSKGIEYTYIESYEYSKTPELKREVTIKALQAAKDKAAYLLNSIGEKLGKVIEIREVTNNGYNFSALSNSINVSSSGDASGSSDGGIDVKKIKLKFQVNAVFEIAGN